MAASEGGDQAPARSAVCVTSPPHLTDDEREWFVPTGGRGGRRAIRVGEHLAPDEPLVLEYPQHFSGSAEPVDCWPIGILSAEGRKRQQAEQLRLASHPARRITPCCARCGYEHVRSVVMHDKPSQLGLINVLSAIDDGDPDSWAERSRIEERFAVMARAAKEQEDELVRIEAEFRASHPQCPEGTPALEQPPVPDNVPLQWRLPGVRTLG